MKIRMSVKNILQLISLSFLAVLLTASTGCSPTVSLSAEDLQLHNKQFSMQLFAARAFIDSTDYERYTFNEQVIWRECGEITPKLRGGITKTAIQENQSHYNADPQLAIIQRSTQLVSTEQRLAVIRHAIALLEALEGSTAAAPAPGSVFELDEPGYFEVEIILGATRKHFTTNIDAVAGADSQTLQRAHSLFAAIRGLGSHHCEQETFYGIGKDTPSAQPNA